MASSKLGVFTLTLLSVYATVDCHCRYGDDECYEPPANTWSMWYIWISVVLTLLCCCGAAGYYCRQYHRQNGVRSRRGRPRYYTYSPDGAIIDPGIYYPPGSVAPVAPPAYDNLARNTGDVTIPVVQPGSPVGLAPVQGTEMTNNNKPPSYTEVFGPTGSRRK